MSANSGDRAPQLGDDVVGAGGPWRVVGLATLHGEVAQVQRASDATCWGVVQASDGSYQLRSTLVRVWFSPAAAAAGESADVWGRYDRVLAEGAHTTTRHLSAEPTPELHEGSERQGLGRVQVRCTCGWASSWQPLGTARKTSVRQAWADHTDHAVTALREAVSLAYALYVAR